MHIHFGDNLPVLRGLPSTSFELIYVDPPFNTGKVQARTRIRTVRDEDAGDRTGFGGKRYRTERLGSARFADDFDDFLAFLEPRLREAHRLLTPQGAFFLHIDYREVHYCKVLLDQIFGRHSFMNEIIWAYDYGARTKRRWSAKHDNLLWYAKDPKHYAFNFDEMDRIPYMAPGLVGKEKAARGKTPTDVWWHTIVPTHGKERTGYPTQKPLGVLQRVIKVHSRPGDRVLDFFAGSGTTGEAAVRLGRSCTLIDDNLEAMQVMARRLCFAHPTFHGWAPDASGEHRDPVISVQVERVQFSEAERDLRAIRREVFIEEQNVPEPEEWDGKDPECDHLLARAQDGTPLGTARLAPGGKVGRMAVRAVARHRGVGSALLRAVINLAREQGLPRLTLDAQLHAIPFYEHQGFRAHGEIFLDAGIEHRRMSRLLAPPPHTPNPHTPNPHTPD